MSDMSAVTPEIRYPIGMYAPPKAFTGESRAAVIASIAQTPAELRRAVSGLTDAQLDTTYRPDGWTVRQVVHHLADAHMILYTRTKIALTEDNPAVKTWDEEPWAELADAKVMPIGGSLAVIDAVHARLAHLLETLTPEQLGRTMVHPQWGTITIDRLVDLCAWHGRHHTAHIAELRKRRGW
jgi:hypothetical protein